MIRWIVSLVWLGAASSALAAERPLTLVHETTVEVLVRLMLHDGGTVKTIKDEALIGAPGERLVVAERVALDGGQLAVGLILTARPDEDDSRCEVRLESEVRADSAPIAHVSRDAIVDAGRLQLIELWGDGEMRRLVLGMVVNWQQVPHLVEVTPGAEPIDIFVEVVLNDAGTPRVVERHRLSGLVGSPVQYVFRRIPGLPVEEPSTGRLIVEILPHAIVDQRAELQIRVRHEGQSPYSQLGALDLGLREQLGPGQSVDLPLPALSGAPSLTFRVRPFF
ncbi:MAG: hypothetical protein JSV80_14000 [Acidobacteriota bacterium]|nr:MAG: hypothetical protein JSV80_14000 [Acidobacteriota bacterium]